MSGGEFDYEQYRINNAASRLEEIIAQQNNAHLNINEEWCIPKYSSKTIDQFKIALGLLRKSAIYLHRIDWLVSADDGEDTFHQRLIEDLTNLDCIK